MDTYKVKKPYNLILMTLGVITIITALSLTTISLGFLLLLPGGLALIISDEGWEFNRVTEEFREYSSNLGITRGKWKSSGNLNYLSIISAKMTSGVSAPGNVASISTTELYYKLILLNAKHSKKIEVFGSKNAIKVKSEGKDLAQFLGIPLVRFSPPVSVGRS